MGNCCCEVYAAKPACGRVERRNVLLSNGSRGLYLAAGMLFVLAGVAQAQQGSETVAEEGSQAVAQAGSETVGQPAQERVQPEIPAISDVTGVLTPKGTLIIEPSIEFAHSSLNRVILEGFTVIPAITVGNIDIRQVDRDVVTAALTARYGVTDRFEVDVKVPYVYRYDRTTTRPLAQGADQDEVTDVEGNGLGDVELGLHYQLNSGLGGGAFYVANLRVKSNTGEDPFEVDIDQTPGSPTEGLETELPTGTGFWGVEPSLTVLFPSDPAVFFANVGYLWNIERDVGIQNGIDFGTIDPGDAIRFSFGMGYGINEQSSFSIGYEHSAVLKSKQDGNAIAGTDLQVGSLLLGWSYRVSERTSYNLTVGIGATDESPDARIELRVPIRFNLF